MARCENPRRRILPSRASPASPLTKVLCTPPPRPIDGLLSQYTSSTEGGPPRFLIRGKIFSSDEEYNAFASFFRGNFFAHPLSHLLFPPRGFSYRRPLRTLTSTYSSLRLNSSPDVWSTVYGTNGYTQAEVRRGWGFLEDSSFFLQEFSSHTPPSFLFFTIVSHIFSSMFVILREVYGFLSSFGGVHWETPRAGNVRFQEAEHIPQREGALPQTQWKLDKCAPLIKLPNQTRPRKSSILRQCTQCSRLSKLK